MSEPEDLEVLFMKSTKVVGVKERELLWMICRHGGEVHILRLNTDSQLPEALARCYLSNSADRDIIKGLLLFRWRDLQKELGRDSVPEAVAREVEERIALESL